MLTSRLVKFVAIPAAALVSEKSKSASTDCVCKPSELPIYTSETPAQQTEVCVPQEPGAIEQTFSTIRRSIFSLMDELKSIEQTTEDYVQTGLENAEFLVNYLQEEDNTTPKYGAIAVGGLAGLILGLRGGLFRRVLYTSAGALGMAAVCYPKEASEYSQLGVTEAKRFATIAYNFIYGVKKDDPPLTLPSLPNMPTSFSEAWGVVKSFGKSSKPVDVADKQEKVQASSK